MKKKTSSKSAFKQAAPPVRIGSEDPVQETLRYLHQRMVKNACRAKKNRRLESAQVNQLSSLGREKA